MPKSHAPAFQIRITLRDSKPEIWRRVLVPANINLSKLHHIIQAAMGWRDSHLHMFKVGGVTFSARWEPGDLEELVAIDERYVKLLQLVQPYRLFNDEFHFACEYTYDFGDSWTHDLVFEDALRPDPARTVPVCIAGERACPPEDVGGIEGYAAFLEAIADPSHLAHEAVTEWFEGPFDPEQFDIDRVNAALRSLK